jgi:heptosyltransferase-2
MNYIKLTLVRLLLKIQNVILSLVAEFPTNEGIGNLDPKRILLLRTSALGDFIFAVPAIAALRKRFPETKIVLLTATTTNATQRTAVNTYAGFESLPWLAFIIPSIVNDAICIYSFRLWGLWTRTRRSVCRFNPDLTIIIANPGEPGLKLLKKIIFLRFLGVRSLIYGWRARTSNKWFRSVQHDAGLFDHHVIGAIRSVAEVPGMPDINKIEIKFPLFLSPSARSWAETFLRNRGWHTRRVVAVAPGSIQPHKRWHLKNFVQLCEMLVSRFDVYIVVIGTSIDHCLGQKLEQAIKGEVVNLAGLTSLSQSAALLERCALVVGNDGGAMHLASAMQCAAVSIVPGLEYPNSVEPWFSREFAVRHPVSCAPCYSFTYCPQGHNKCMSDISVYDVYIQCSRILS